MGRKKIPDDKKIKRLDVYIETAKHKIIFKNQLMPEIIEGINKIIEKQ